MSCDHEKVFSGEYLATSPPQWAWVCATCREQGTAIMPEKPTAEPYRYCDIVGPDAAWLRRILDQRHRAISG